MNANLSNRSLQWEGMYALTKRFSKSITFLSALNNILNPPWSHLLTENRPTTLVVFDQSRNINPYQKVKCIKHYQSNVLYKFSARISNSTRRLVDWVDKSSLIRPYKMQVIRTCIVQEIHLISLRKMYGSEYKTVKDTINPLNVINIKYRVTLTVWFLFVY